MNTSPTEQPSMSDSQLLEDRDSLEVERKLFKEQKANFDEERRVFTDAAIRLGREVGKIFVFFLVHVDLIMSLDAGVPFRVNRIMWWICASIFDEKKYIMCKPIFDLWHLSIYRSHLNRILEDNKINLIWIAPLLTCKPKSTEDEEVDVEVVRTVISFLYHHPTLLSTYMHTHISQLFCK